MPMDMARGALHPLGVLCRHIGVGFLLFIFIRWACEGLELQISNSRSTLFLCVYVVQNVGLPRSW